MAEGLNQISLPESDYLAILDINARFHQCRTIEEVQQLASSDLLPLMKAEHMGVAFTDMDIGGQSLFGQRPFMQSFMPSFETKDQEFEAIMKAMAYYKSIGKLLSETFRPVFAYDIDIPRLELRNELNQFFKENPQYDDDSQFYLKNVASFLGMNDPPDWNLSVGFNRFYEDAEAWTAREIRIAELIRPHMFQSIKSIAVNLELKKYRTLAEALADTPTPIALVDEFHRLIYQNEAFKKVSSSKPGDKINPRLVALLEGEGPQPGVEGAVAEEIRGAALSYVQLESGVYRFVSSQVESPEGDRESRLIRLKPVVEPYAKLNLSLREKGLTPREIEISYLVRDGMDDEEIADRLFISLHTVRTHIKSIYKKMDISSRAKLVAALHS